MFKQIRKLSGSYLFFVLAPLFLAPTAPGYAREQNSCEVPELYLLRPTWQQTMLASRRRVESWRRDQQAALQSVKLGPWYLAGPFKTGQFTDFMLPVKYAGLNTKGHDNAGLWQKRPDLVDEKVHSLPDMEKGATYLFRTITAEKPLRFIAGLGSNDGLEFWFNGDKLASFNVARDALPDQDYAILDLRPGDNHLLLKVFNIRSACKFYFSLRHDPGKFLWRQIEKDFPQRAKSMKHDIGDIDPAAWFNSTDNVELEEKMIRSVLEKVDGVVDPVRGELASMQQAKVSPHNERWLELYCRTIRLRDDLSLLKPAKVKALRLAVKDLITSFPDRYPHGREYLSRVDEFARRLLELQWDLADNDQAARVRSELFVQEFLNFQQEALLENPLLDFDKLLLVKRGEKNLGLPQNWQGNCAMGRTGYDNEIAILSAPGPRGGLTTFFKPPAGEFVGDVDLHFDAEKMLFSMPGSSGRWQIWEINADGTGLRQVTPGPHPDVDNYDACYLPDGRIIFDSTRCFTGVPCVGGSNTVANLCIMNPDGSGIRQLCFDQDHNWCPTVLNNGRVLYTRWEYSDTPHYFTRLLFNMNPDGTGQAEYYGSNSYWPNSTFYARPLPKHPTSVVAVISGHHGVPRMGELVIFDPAKGRHEAEGAVQKIPGYGKKVDPVIMDLLVDNSWPKFLHPYPLSDKYFLVSAKPTPKSLWGVYLVDIFDNITLIKEQPGYVLFEPVPLKKTPRPPIIPDKVSPDKKDATVYLADIYAGNGMRGVPRGTVKKLRLYEFHFAYPKTGGHVNIGIEATWDVHRILGTVPVFKDGSAIFKVPANTPIAVQPLDDEGKAIQVMRSWFTAMPGETLSCVGCHEKQNSTPPTRQTIASQRRPVEITPWYGPPRGFSFKREIQPVLDKYCAACHNGQPRPDGKGIPDFTAKQENGWKNFTPSYIALHPYVRRPGLESDYHQPNPYEYHADTSELVQMLTKDHHNVRLDAQAWDRIITWIDLNVPDHGTWGEHREVRRNFRQRRLEMFAAYANREQDPEVIPAVYTVPLDPVMPQPQIEPAPKNITSPGWPFDTKQAKARQHSAAANPRKTIDLGDGIIMEMVLVPAGRFVMGSLDGPADQRPLSRVEIDRPFLMSVTEITNSQFRRFDPAHDSGFLNKLHKDHSTRGYPVNQPDQPVIRVSWNQAMAFCTWLSDKTGLEFTLPAEAQWEWACRAGSQTPFNYGDLDADFSTHANLADLAISKLTLGRFPPRVLQNPDKHRDFIPKDTRFNDGARIVADVGGYLANPWGLKDMHGNVAEWTRSKYQPYPCNESDGRNDTGCPAKRVVRGGSWRDRPHRATSAFRLAYLPHQQVFNVGLRVICRVE